MGSANAGSGCGGTLLEALQEAAQFNEWIFKKEETSTGLSQRAVEKRFLLLMFLKYFSWKCLCDALMLMPFTRNTRRTRATL